MRWVVRILVVILLLVAAAMAGTYFILTSSLPGVNGNVAVARSLSAPIGIVRDRNAVPHIEAASENDSAFGLGYAHAQDRLWQMEVNRRIAAGRLSEIFGPSTLGTDKFLRTLGIRLKALASFKYLRPETQSYLQAYADGVNAFLATRRGFLPPEFLAFGIEPEPWTPADSLGWLKMMAWDLSGNWGTELARLTLARRLTPQQIREFFPPYPGDGPVALADMGDLYRHIAESGDLEGLWRNLPAPRPSGIGSNNWVVSGRHTVAGTPLLANDPHLGLTSPSIWYLAHLATPAGNVIGASLPGIPGIILGHNDRIAWGFTNTGPDTQDLYLERLLGSDRTQYETPSGPLPFTIRQEIIQVRGEPDVTITVRGTRHGPVISDVYDGASQALPEGYVLSFAWTALRDDDTTADALVGLASIHDWAEFTENFRRYVNPQQNIVYADRDGNIGFIAPGLVPVRRQDNDLKGLAPAPGWDARYDWTGFIPFEDLPKSYNPARGTIVTANNKIVPDSYPYFITSEWADPYRARRIEQLLAERSVHSVESFKQMQGDVTSLMVADLLPLMMAAPVKAKPRNPEIALGRDLLSAWDGTMAANHAEPLIFAAWYRELTRLVLADELGDDFTHLWRFRPQLMKNILGNHSGQSRWCRNVATAQDTPCSDLVAEALDRAYDDLKSRYGNDPGRWRWGEAHFSLSQHRPFSRIPVLRNIFTVSVPAPGDAFTVNAGQYSMADDDAPYADRHGVSFRAIYDLADLNRSLFIDSTGQSGHPLSIHYRDFAASWATVQYIPISAKPQEYQAGAGGKLQLVGQ